MMTAFLDIGGSNDDDDDDNNDLPRSPTGGSSRDARPPPPPELKSDDDDVQEVVPQHRHDSTISGLQLLGLHTATSTALIARHLGARRPCSYQGKESALGKMGLPCEDRSIRDDRVLQGTLGHTQLRSKARH
ncbi:unnamed protein product [Closterium sp. NIES-54]